MRSGWIVAILVGLTLAAPVAEAKKPPAPEAGQMGGQEGQSSDGSTPDGVVYYEASDAAMNAAIAEAQRWTPAFLADFRQTPAYDRASYSLKVGLPTPFGGFEHIWVDQLRYENDQLVGALANQPVELPGLRLGSRVVIDEAQISDWMIVRGELAYGAYTMRVMLDDLPREDADAMRAFLARDPVPPDWRP